MIKTRSVKSNIVFNTLFQLLTYAIPLITIPYVARVLGADHLGQYSYALSIVTYFTLIATLGSSTHGQRIVAYNRDDPIKLSYSFWNTVSFRIITTTGATILYLLFLALFKHFSVLEFIVVLNIINVAVDISWFYQGIENFQKTATRGLVVKIVGLIGIFVFVRSQNDTWLYALILLGSTVIGNLILWKGIITIVGKPHSVSPFCDFKDIILVFLPTIATQVYLVLDKSMIGWITHSDYENGCYDQSEKIIRVLLVLISSISSVILPRVANLFNNEDINKAKLYVYKAYRLVLLLSLPFFFGIIAVSSIFIPVFLGNGFSMSIVLLQIFSWLLIVVSLASITGLAYLIPTKQQNVYTISVSVAALANLAMNLLLIPKIGAYGAAISSIAAETIGTIIQIWYCISTRQLELKNIFSPSWKYLVSGILMYVVLMLFKPIIPVNILGLTIIIMIGIIVYFFILFLLKDSFTIEQAKQLKSRLL